MKKLLYVFEKDNLSLKNSISALIVIAIISGIFGFIYEEIFYYIDLGYLVKRGSTYGPLIPVYFFGGFFIVLLTYRFKEKPLKVLLLNVIITGSLEFLTGYVLLKVFNLRLWDYNTEIWNFGNIGGFICLRSILFFSISSLFLIYVIVPFVIKLYKKYNDKTLRIAIIIKEMIEFFSDKLSFLNTCNSSFINSPINIIPHLKKII